MTKELKQVAQQALMECPFCGSEPHDAHHIEYGRWAVTCRCGAKGASANTGPNATDAAKIKAYSDARTAWNTRAIPALQSAQPAAAVSDEEIEAAMDAESYDRHCCNSYWPIKFARAILALRPQAVPMTDEQIMAELKACDREDPSKEGWIWRTRIKWARAIEAHHGITQRADGG